MPEEQLMSDHTAGNSDLGLQFFGKVSASISHEMKNVLAIINENIGLLEDLAYIAEKGQVIDPERLQRTCLNMTRQIKRGDTIMKNLNAFGHSIDEREKMVDLCRLMELVASLAERRAALRKVSLAVQKASQPVTLLTNPFLLQNLLWLFLEEAIEAVPSGSVLQLLVEQEALIKIEGAGELMRDNGEEKVPAAMLAELEATFQTSSNGRCLLIMLHRPDRKTV